MKERAIGKIKSEMEKNKSNLNIQIIGNFILNQIHSNPMAAEKILNEGKTLAKSLDEMKKVAEKKRAGNCAILSDQEGFEIVLKYFGIDRAMAVSKEDVKEIKVQVPSTAQSKPNIKFDVSLEDFLK